MIPTQFSAQVPPAMFAGRVRTGWIGAWAALALGVVSAHAGSSPCPAFLKTRQVAAVPQGFTSTKPKAAVPAPLMEMSFFDRDLGPAAALEPDEIRRFPDGTLVSTWTFPRGNWHPNQLRCTYFGTQIALVRTLDPKISACVATYDKALKLGGVPLIRSIDCK